MGCNVRDCSDCRVDGYWTRLLRPKLTEPGVKNLPVPRQRATRGQEHKVQHCQAMGARSIMTRSLLFSSTLSHSSHATYARLREQTLKSGESDDSKDIKYAATTKKWLRKVVCIEETGGMV